MSIKKRLLSAALALTLGASLLTGCSKGADGSGSPSAVFSLRLANRRLHAEMLVSLAGLDCVYAVEEY